MRYTTPPAFDRAIVDRIAQLAAQTRLTPAQLRLSIAFDRLLARLNSTDGGDFVVKGGVALEYRIGHQARPTKDLDLAMTGFPAARDALRNATTIDLGDHFSLRINEEPQVDKPIVDGVASYRWKLGLWLGTKPFSPLTLDIGIERTSLSPPDLLEAPDLLGFAGLPRTSVRVIPVHYHLAEKLHAYSRTYAGNRPSTRVKDLVDIVLLGQHYDLDAGTLVEAVEGVFESRSTHPIPSAFPDPPASWASPYKALAQPIGLVSDLSSAADSGRAIFAPVFLRERARLPVFHPQSHELIERREDLTITADQTMRVLGQSADGQRILGRSGGSLLSVSREAFTRLPKVEQIVTVTHENGRDVARATDREIGLER